MTEKLSRSDELKLRGLRAIADHHNRALQELIPVVAEIVGSDDRGGWVVDFVYDSDVSVKKLWAATAAARLASKPLEMKEK
jgi:hypothetical protein